MSFAKNGDTNVSYKHGFIKGAQWQQANSRQQVIEMLDTEIGHIKLLREDERLNSQFGNYDYAVFILTGILKNFTNGK